MAATSCGSDLRPMGARSYRQAATAASRSGRWATTRRARSIAGAGGKAMIWDAATGRVVLETPDIDANGEIAFSPDGRYLAVPSEKGLLATWEIATGQMRQSFTGKTDPVEAAALRRDDRWLVLSDYNSLHFWDLQSGQAARPLPLP